MYVYLTKNKYDVFKKKKKKKTKKKTETFCWPGNTKDEEEIWQPIFQTWFVVIQWIEYNQNIVYYCKLADIDT